jgi:NAD(P)H dehydrogenase (quinone)
MRKSDCSPGRRAVVLALAASASTAMLPAVAAPHSARGDSAGGAQDRIIISGASGHLGEATVRALLARGVAASRLILVSRTPERLERFARMGASVRPGDFTRPESLPEAFAGGKHLLLISIGFGPMPRPQAHKNAIDAAVAAGVQQIAYTSFIALSRGDHRGLGADHFATEQLLEKSGAHWTMLRNSIYMETLIPQAARMVATGRAQAPEHEDRIGYVAREDCAAAAAAVLATPGHDGKAYDITGPQLIGVREVAQAASAVTGRPVRIEPAPAGAAARRPFGGPAVAVVSEAVRQLTGHPAIALEAFLAQHRAAIEGGAKWRAGGAA